MAGFDWYQATLPHPVDDVLEVLLALDSSAHLVHRKGMHSYATDTVVEGVDGPVGRVWHGGTQEYPHVVLTGDAAREGSVAIRANFPLHAVTRLDANEDYDEVGAFDQILPYMLAAAARHRVKVGTAGDHLLTMEGRTAYLGSPKSACRLRLYDKAAELRAQFAYDPIRLAAIPQSLTRFEAQVRPQGRENRVRFASIQPAEVMGSAKWLREVWRDIGGIDPAPVQVGKPWRQADDDRAYSFMLSQYGGLLKRKAVEHGSWACVGAQIGSDLAERAKVRK